MKKIFLGIALMLFAFNVNALTVPDVGSGNKVTIYLFKGDGCAYCSKAISYFASLNNEYEDYFDVISYEVWSNTFNGSVLDEVKKELDIEASGVPLIIIGRDYHLVGFDESYGDTILTAAFDAYQNEDYKDVVELVSKNASGNVVKETLEEAAEKEGINFVASTDESSNSSKDAYILFGIFGFILLGIGSLIWISKKQT